ncbi:hypothetical protein RDI58_024679 [Solanum bulbocastanum]|uniref:Uncharacterized protein n=1 Tax=Solanum bulbocastanum TaxID=147425 RepID=A0AAN8T3P7_SOLBU
MVVFSIDWHPFGTTTSI